MTAYSGESLDVNVGEVNVHYHDVFNQFADSTPNTVDDADFNLYREIWQATILVIRERDMGQTWEDALVDYPNTERLQDDDGVFWIINHSNTAQASEGPPVTEEKIKPRVWLAQHGFLPKEQSGQIYDAQPDVVLARGDTAFDLFFYLKLCNTRPLGIDQFLAHQLTTNFGEDSQVFRRYITLNTGEHDWLLPVPTIIKMATDTWFEAVKTTIDINQNIHESGVKWMGSKVDLIKLIHALYHAGLLKKGERSVIEVCEKMAAFLGIDYNKDDNSLSTSITDADKHGHNHYAFIDKIRKGFEKYLDSPSLKRSKKNA